MGYETHKRDSYTIIFEAVGGRKNKYNSPDHGKPSKPGKPPKHGEFGGHSIDYELIPEENQPPQPDEGIGNVVDNFGQSQSPPQGVFQPAQGAYAWAYSTPYPYHCPPPPYPNQLAVGGYNGDYHVQGYAGSFVPHQVGYVSHGGGHMEEVGLVGAAVGIFSYGMYKLMRERRGQGGGH